MSDGQGVNAEPDSEPDSEIEIDTLLQEGRRFSPSEAFREKAHLKDTSLYDEADKDYEAFWARMAGELDGGIALLAVVGSTPERSRCVESHTFALDDAGTGNQEKRFVRAGIKAAKLHPSAALGISPL